MLSPRCIPAFLLASAGLLWLMPGGPGLFDTGELVAAAWALGGSHPPGQPLYSLLVHFFSGLPLGDAYLRAATLSLLSEVVASALAAMLVLEVSHPRLDHAPQCTPRWQRTSAAFAAAAGVFLCPSLFDQAYRPEVYGLALGLTLLGFLCTLRYVFGGSDTRWMVASAFAAGLCWNVHPPHAASIVLAAVLAVALQPPTTWPRARAIGLAALACLAGIAPVVYLPLRAAKGAPMWGEPTTWNGLWSYVSGSAYHTNLQLPSFQQLSESLSFIVSSSGYLPAFGMLMLLAVRGHAKRLRRTLFACLVGAALPALLQPIDVQVPDNIAYLAPLAALLFAVGACGILRLRRGAIVACLLVALGLNLPALANLALPDSARASEDLKHLYVTLPGPEAAVALQSDFAGSAWSLATEVEQLRPDVALLVEGLATSSWHWKSLSKHPLFTGQPILGPGDTIHQRLVRGFVSRAYKQVHVLAESTFPVGGKGTTLGPYLSLPPKNQRKARQAYASQLTDQVIRQHNPNSRHAAVIRQFISLKAERLLARHNPLLATSYLKRGSGWHSASRQAKAPTTLIPPAPVVVDPRSLLVSRSDLVRQLATYLDVLKQTDTARTLLQRQLEGGDPLALLQLAVIYKHHGDHARASRAAAAFVQQQPEQRSMLETYHLTVE